MGEGSVMRLDLDKLILLIGIFHHNLSKTSEINKFSIFFVIKVCLLFLVNLLFGCHETALKFCMLWA